MGLFDRFKGRRQSEDALAQARAGEQADPAAAAPAPSAGPPPPAPSLGIGEAPSAYAGGTQIPGIENMGALGAMIQQAAASGNMQVIQQPTQTVNVENAMAARQAVMDVLAKHGINTTPGQAQAISVNNVD